MGLVDKNGTIITPVGGVASAALPAAVDAGQPVRAYFDQNGRLHVVLDGESVVVNVGEVQIEGSSDGGTTWYPVKVSAAGVQTHAIDQTTPGTTNGVTLTQLLAGEDLVNNRMDVEQHNVYTNVTAAGTTVV